MLKDTYIKISLEKDGWKRQVKTLCWQGEFLVDYVGINKYSLSGEITSRGVNWTYRFDKVISSPDGKYSVVLENYGTKGLVLEGDRLIREINRSYYCAESYEYPLTIFRSLDGRICLAHCPEEYNQIEIEDIETGERLTSDRESHDFFQSRLQASPDGKYLLSAGWVWHPVDMVEVYDLENISSSEYFNLCHDETLNLFELNSAAFVGNSVIAVTGNGEGDENDKYICAYDIEKRSVLSKSKLNESAGNLMAVGEKYVVGFYEHPKLINLRTGEILKEWKEISSGKQNSSINVQNEKYPPTAIDIERKRFAIADENFIHVVSFNE
jgi:WD40 repeat protein